MNTPALPAHSPAAALQGAVQLDDWGVIRASGADAQRFLHGQLTQDIEHLEPGAARLAGFCSAKGRLLASFVIWRSGDAVLLACSADLLPAALKRLQMFVLRAQCKLTDASAELRLWGLAGAAATEALGATAPAAVWTTARVGDADVDVEVVRLPDGAADGHPVPRWLWAGDAPPPALPALDAELWRGLEAASGVARIVNATVEQFVPQMINFELVGGVNFQKGCYPGQEIVARSQYRGTLKRRAQVLHAGVPLLPGQEVFHDADPGQPAGRVVLGGAGADGSHIGLVELKLSALAGGTLHLAAAEGPLLSVGALPYAIPMEPA
ncbi:MAG: folate-binding protein [Rubrivivax sp.]|nr:folate-binding protein [Rubrivivax sp.]